MVSSSIPTAEAVSPPGDQIKMEKADFDAEKEDEKIDSVECKSVEDSESPSSHEAEGGVRTSSTGHAIVTRKELWSYYLYMNGNNGIGPYVYSLILFQSLANAAGYDPISGVGSSCSAPGASGQCVVSWGKGTKAVSSVVLVASSISFTIMTVLFTTLGSAADYGMFARWLLLITTLINWAVQFASMSLTKPTFWPAAMVIYIVNFVSYGAICVLYAAVFPLLARNTARTDRLRELYAAGEISKGEYEVEESLEKNRISNISNMHYTVGASVTACLNIALLVSLAKNPLLDNYIMVFITAYAAVLGVWWFIFQQPRPGPLLPPGEHYLLIGWKQILEVIKQYKKLPYTTVYLLAFFLLSDGFNTTGTLVFILQNQKFKFSFLQTTYLTLAQTVPSIVGTLGFWYVQKYWKISTKKMFMVTAVVAVVIPLWGMIGIWTIKFGFHQNWEFWAYNAIFGLFQAPYFAFSQTMMAELTPPGFDNMFFSIFGLSNRASSMIGPNVTQAIIDRSGNNWDGFPFLFAQCLAASVVIYFGVNMGKGREHALGWAKARSNTRI